MAADEGRIVDAWDHNGQRIVLRTARWADLDGYAALHRALHHERVMAATLDPDTRRACEMLAQRLTQAATGTGLLLVAEVNGRIVGEGTLSPSSGAGSITLGILIQKEFRRRGIGRRMMLALEAEARRMGRERIDLTVWSANEPAIRLYQSLGYHEVGRFPDWIRSDLAPGGSCDLIWMVKYL